MLQDRILICDPTHPNERISASTRRATSAPASAISPSLTLDAPLDRLWTGPARQVHRHAPADAGRGSDRPRARASGAVSFPTGSGTSTSAATAAPFSYGFDAHRQPALHLLPHRRVRHELQRRRLRDRVRRISADAAHRDHASTSTMRSTRTASRDRLLFRPNRADPDVSVRRVPRPQPPHRSFGLTLKQSFGGGGDEGGEVAA